MVKRKLNRNRKEKKRGMGKLEERKRERGTGSQRAPISQSEGWTVACGNLWSR